MHRERETQRLRQGTDNTTGFERARCLPSESLLIRNYDHHCGHDLFVEARRLDDGQLFERQYFLPPGGTVAETDALPPGRYELAVELDGDTRSHLRGRLDDTPRHTAVVEVGNGVLSVTAGITR